MYYWTGPLTEDTNKHCRYVNVTKAFGQWLRIVFIAKNNYHVIMKKFIKNVIKSADTFYNFSAERSTGNQPIAYSAYNWIEYVYHEVYVHKSCV
jgi:hypothetical protein